VASGQLDHLVINLQLPIDIDFFFLFFSLLYPRSNIHSFSTRYKCNSTLTRFNPASINRQDAIQSRCYPRRHGFCRCRSRVNSSLLPLLFLSNFSRTVTVYACESTTTPSGVASPTVGSTGGVSPPSPTYVSNIDTSSIQN
jgi:hypothetical protein